MNLFVARDFDGSLYLYAMKPRKYDLCWDIEPRYKKAANIIPSAELNTQMFIDVAWSDANPKIITLEELVELILIYNGKIFVDKKLKEFSKILNRLSL